MDDFHATLAIWELVNFGYHGPKFTWNDGREGEDFIR
jgi:hypothetical protein